ncbi:hypothetical protein [Leptolyngbya sp. NIES-2104]|uniref:hypothetical protein n=1 Tax=Leptolyngbya sp. NIES-2104 TaxID=1552121 RepID=UPI0006EC4C5E|nr:hypothetical protein [Leptolyngbya sp. NIES-2104]GAP99206.1 hypothetical protein NIES2104_57660 [Leptolyngbya sp. NIES-2104]
MVANIQINRLSQLTTEELKAELLSLVHDRDTDPLNQKVAYAKNELAPYFEELQQRNPYPAVESQVPIVLGVWTPVWSTIPFHDVLPGRLHDCSYQIFLENGYYANIARYAPGSRFKWLDPILAAYDFMVMQKFEIRDGEWFIQNVAIEQTLRWRAIPLTIERAEAWFHKVLESRWNEFTQKTSLPQELKLDNVDKTTLKKLEKTYRATPKFEHVYVDETLRIVKTQREEKQRPSYTIAVRRK